MNRFIFTFLVFCGYASLHAQSIGLCNQVIGSTGRSVVKQGRTYDYTVGEAVIFTLRKSNVDGILTQGFHQPDICPPAVSVHDGLSQWQILAYPNPVNDRLTLQFSADQPGLLDAAVIDLLGRTRMQVRQIAAPGHVFDCAGLEPGVYFLNLTDPATAATATLRWIKL